MILGRKIHAAWTLDVKTPCAAQTLLWQGVVLRSAKAARSSDRNDYFPGIHLSNLDGALSLNRDRYVWVGPFFHWTSASGLRQMPSMDFEL